MEAYCTRQGVQFSSLRFLFDGNRLQPEQCPRDVDLEDNDVIGKRYLGSLVCNGSNISLFLPLFADAVVSQTGGF